VTTSFHRIVVRAPNWLGDIVMAMPAIAAIRRHFPNAALSVAAPAPFAAFCQALPGVEAVTPLEGRGVRAMASHVAALRAGRFDLAILLTNSFITALEAQRAGIPARWGVRRDLRGPLLTRAIARPGKTAQKRRSAGAQGGDESQEHGRARGQGGQVPATHHARYYLALLEAMDIPAPMTFTPLSLGDEPRAAARTALVARGWTSAVPLVALAPGAAYGGAKRWPATHAADAIRALHVRGVRTVLVGAGADRDAARAIESALAAAGGDGGALAPINLVGETSLAQLMAVLSWCRLVLANDSGAMHVAAAVGRPVVAVFGPTNEAATAPLGPHAIVRHDVWCRPCLLRECPLDHACMQGVTGADVVRAAEAWLERPEGETV
jgi:heptosyltransferase II